MIPLLVAIESRLTELLTEGIADADPSLSESDRRSRAVSLLNDLSMADAIAMLTE